MAIHKIDGVDGVVSRAKKFVTLYAQGAITKGDVVGIGTVVTKGAGLHVTVTDATTALLDGSIRAIGVAAEAATDGQPVRIQVAGYNSDATSGAAAIAVNLEVQYDIASAAGKAGCLMTAAATDVTHKPFGITVTAYSGAEQSDGAIFIYDHGYYG